MAKEEFVYKFEGKKLKGTKVPYSFLVGVIDNIAKIADRVNEIDNDSNRNIDFNVEIKNGSVEICTSAFDDDSVGLGAIRKTSQIINDFPSQQEQGVYLNDLKIKRGLISFIKSTYDLADSLKILHNGVEIGEKIGLNEDTLGLIEFDEVQESFLKHIVLLHKINSKNMTIGLTVPGQEVINANIPTAFISDLKGFFNEFIYVKIDNSPQSKKLIDFNSLNVEDTKINEELNKDLLKRVEKLENISNLPEKWDGYNGKKFSLDVIGTANNFLKKIIVLINRLNLQKILPNISPVPNGNLQFEWEIADKYLEIEFDGDDNYHILRSWLSNGIEKEKEFTVASYEQTLDSIFWILKR